MIDTWKSNYYFFQEGKFSDDYRKFFRRENRIKTMEEKIGSSEAYMNLFFTEEEDILFWELVERSFLSGTWMPSPSLVEV